MQVSSAGLPILKTYEMALNRYNEVVPFRSGRRKGERPLGSNRRYLNCLIEKIDETEAIIAKLYGHDVITYHKDGAIEISLCVDSITTRQFISALLWVPCFAYQNTTYLTYKNNDYCIPTNTYVLRIEQGQVVNPYEEKVYKLQRKAYNEVMKQYDVFTDYIRNVGKLLTDITKKDMDTAARTLNGGNGMRLLLLEIPKGYRARVHGMDRLVATLEDFLKFVRDAMRENDLEKMYAAFINCAVCAASHDSYLKYAIASQGADKLAMNTLVELVKFLHRDEVFHMEVAPVGKKISNVNRKYFI